MAVHVTIYTRSFCGYCTAAKRFLSNKGITFEEIDCTGDPTTRKWLVATTGRSTVPQIFIAQTPIGGYTEMRSLERRGELDRLLAGHGSSGSG